MNKTKTLRKNSRSLATWWAGFAGLCFFFLLGCDASTPQKAPPRANKGVLDLSQWNFAQEGTVALSGEYEFYWQRHIAPESFASSPQVASDFITVPGIWNDHEIAGQNIGGEGYATYRLRVRLPELVPLALKFIDMATAFTAYANGAQVFSAGVPGMTRENTTPRYAPDVVTFTPYARELELVIHVANFHHQKGGAWEPIKLGLAQDLQHTRARALQLDMLLFGAIVIMGLYHLGLFAVRTEERAPLYFGLFCLLIAVRLVVISERLALQFFPHTSWELLNKLEYLVYYLAPPTGALLLHALYEKDFSKIILRVILAFSAGFALLVLVTPIRFFSQTVAWHHAYTILCCAYGVFVIVMATLRRREGATIHLAGFSLLSLTIGNDILNYFYVLHTPLLLPLGLLAFIFSQATLLAFRSSSAFRTIGWQRVELEKALRQYERELLEKRRLEVQYRALYNDNPTMYFTVDANGNVLSVNQFGLQYLGYKAEELIGQAVGRIFHEEDRPRVPEQLATCLLEPERVHEWELRKRRKDGSILWVKETARCVQNQAGRPLLLIVCEDITARKQTEAEVHALRERLRALSLHLQAAPEQDRVGEARATNGEMEQAISSLNLELNMLARKIEQSTGKFEAPALLHQIEVMQNLLLALLAKARR